MMMKRLIVAMCVATAIPAAADKAHDLATERLGALKTAARCDNPRSPQRAWCIAAAFDSGTPADLPRGKQLVGLTIELQAGKDVGDALVNKVSLSALVIGSDGKVKLTSITPSNKDEEVMIGKAVGEVAAVFKGASTTAAIPADLAGYIKSLRGSYGVTHRDTELVWSGGSSSRARKVGSMWVVIETPSAQNGVFATILTEAWQ
jgi:hypothetical protein